MFRTLNGLLISRHARSSQGQFRPASRTANLTGSDANARDPGAANVLGSSTDCIKREKKPTSNWARFSVTSLASQAKLSCLTLAAGETDPQRLANLVHPSLQPKHDQLVQALESEGGEHDQFVLRELLSLIETLDRSMARARAQIGRAAAPLRRDARPFGRDYRGEPAHLVCVVRRGRNGYESFPGCCTSGFMGRNVSGSA